jgi:hypothetical protein
MKTTLLRAMFVLPVIASLSAQALPISGEIHFTGGGSLNDTFLDATGFTSLDLFVLGGSQTGDYVGVPGGTSGGWSTFDFDPAPATVSPLWNIVVGSITYSFNATSVVIVDRGSTHLDLGGTGIARMTGRADTHGDWSLGVTGARTTFAFVASTRAQGEAVPEGGTTSVLLALTAAGLAIVRNKTQVKQANLP